MALSDRIRAALANGSDLSQSGLAKACGISRASVNAWVNGKTDSIDGKYLTTAAYYLGVSAHWLSTGEGPMHEGAGEAAIHSNTSPGPEIRGKVPLISWVRAGELCETHDNYHPGDAEHWMDCPVPHGPRTYCLEISGDSMDDGGADAYRDGEIIFVDPDASPEPGRDVVVRTPDNKTTFKRLKEDTEGRYLLGLNGKKIVRVPEDTVFCGVVIFSGRRR